MRFSSSVLISLNPGQASLTLRIVNVGANVAALGVAANTPTPVQAFVSTSGAAAAKSLNTAVELGLSGRAGRRSGKSGSTIAVGGLVSGEHYRLFICLMPSFPLFFELLVVELSQGT